MAVDGPVFSDAWQVDHRIGLKNYLQKKYKKYYKAKCDLPVSFRFMRGLVVDSL